MSEKSEKTEKAENMKRLFHGRMIYLGEIVGETPVEFKVKNCSWMADMGVRFSELLKNGIVEGTRIEVAPPDVIVEIPRGGFVRYEWKHPLPTKDQP